MSNPESDAFLDKILKIKGKKQYHLHVKPGDVGKYVLLPGDPDRVLRIGRHLENVQEVAFHREYRTVTGTYKGIRVSATSTGIGCPSAAIAIEELVAVGAENFIRVGSTAAVQAHIKMGDLIINTATQRNDGTSRAYVDEGFPAIADHFLTHALIEAAAKLKQERGFNLHLGIGCSDDAFYADSPNKIQLLTDSNILNMEMEAAALLPIAHLRGVKAAVICGVSGNLVTKEVVYEGVNTQLVEAWDNAIDVALEGIVRLENSGLKDEI